MKKMMNLSGNCLILFIGLFIAGCKPNPSSTKNHDISSGSQAISYVIDRGNPRKWTINLDLHPDQLAVECGNKPVEVRFISDIDSNSIYIKKGESVKFNIYFNNDTAETEVTGVPFNIRFSDEFTEQNRGTFKVEVPEVFELVNILFSLTDRGIEDDNMVYKETAYYAEVSSYFAAFKDHPVVDCLNKYLDGKHGIGSYGFYYNVRTNAPAYEFRRDRIVNGEIYRKMDWRPENYLEELLPLVEDFARQSHFRSFYKSHSDYYSSLVEKYKSLCPVEDMWQWLEKRSDERYDQYKIIFSPLIGGAHNTQRFTDNGFRQVIMFVNIPGEKPDNISIEAFRARIIRTVFTEIDHNYVNPVSEGFDIAAYMTDLAYWNIGGKGYYDTPLLTFNEYMTWSLCFAYLEERLSDEDFADFSNYTELMMEKNRGFAKFSDFNKKLLEIYSLKDQGAPIESFYPELLSWMKDVEASDN